MNISENGLNVIKNFEGLVLHPYRDAVGVVTIGYGSTRWGTGRPISMDDPPIDEETANNLLLYAVNNIIPDLTEMVKATLNQNQTDALISFAYNVGTGGLHGSTLLKRVNVNPSDPTIRNAFMLWDKGHVDGQLVVIPDLAIRRKQEADLYFSS